MPLGQWNAIFIQFVFDLKQLNCSVHYIDYIADYIVVVRKHN